MATRNIVIAPCGNRAYLFNDCWLKYKQEKNFDVCLLFYHAQVNNPQLYAGVEYFYQLKDFKYHMIYELLTKVHPEWLEQYDYFYFLDDDIEIDTRQINQMFLLSHTFNSWISQASLTKNSFCSWPMFKQQQNSFCRYVGQIEVMAPLFNRFALNKCLPSFIGNKSSWGVDSVWSKVLGYPEDKLIVFDTVNMKHTQPVGGGELYQKIGVDPHQDWKAVTDLYGAKKHNYREYGRLQFVNKSTNRIIFFTYRSKAFFVKIRRAWLDYDLNSRIVSQKKKFLKKLNVKTQLK